MLAAAALAICVGALLGLKGAAIVVDEQRRSGTATDLATHLQPAHVLHGAWAHHLKPALANVLSGTPRPAAQ
jgi:hypothetical protein